MRAAAIVENNGRRQLEVVDNLPEPAPGECSYYHYRAILRG